jgi:hypothetical protein
MRPYYWLIATEIDNSGKQLADGDKPGLYLLAPELLIWARSSLFVKYSNPGIKVIVQKNATFCMMANKSRIPEP